jgi:hypothetical protein
MVETVTTFTTTEIQTIEVQKAIEVGRIEARAPELNKQLRSDMVRLAKDTLVQNRLDQPSGSREITTADITAYATELLTFVNA